MTHCRNVVSIAISTLSLVTALMSFGCSRGYVETADLERHDRGPTACASRCAELGMRMGALVLVSDSTPACVCEPNATAGASVDGAAGAASGHVVIAAAAAAQQQQQRQNATATSTTVSHR